jgi:MinD-like ATPase involved in chromosome partitioning or flagellar assembly
MAKIISFHSFLRRVGKSTLAANFAVLLALKGRRVGVVDANLEAPSLHLLFGLDEGATSPSLNDYLRGECAVEQTVRDLTPYLETEVRGRVFAIPASTDLGTIARGMREGYNVSRLGDGYGRLIEALRLDALVIDTHAGLSELTLLSLAVSDVAAIVLNLDQQGYQGTSVIVALAHRLEVPRPALVVNPVPLHLGLSEVKKRVEQTYHCEVAVVLPQSDDLLALGGSGVFALRHPNHPLTGMLQETVASLVG